MLWQERDGRGDTGKVNIGFVDDNNVGVAGGGRNRCDILQREGPRGGIARVTQKDELNLVSAPVECRRNDLWSSIVGSVCERQTTVCTTSTRCTSTTTNLRTSATGT